MYNKDEINQIGNTIIRQMGGSGKLKAMVGAHNYLAGTNENNEVFLSFRFKGSRSYNYCRVTLNHNDTYTISIGQIRKKNYVPTYTERYTCNDVYFDMLKPIFERETGLYLSL